MKEIKYELDKISLSDLFKQFENGNITFVGEEVQETDSWVFELLEEILHGHYHGVTIELMCEGATYDTKGVIQHDITPYALWQLFKKRENSKHQVCLNLNNTTVSLSQPSMNDGLIPLYAITDAKKYYQYTREFGGRLSLHDVWEKSANAIQKCVFPVVKIINS